MASAFSLEDPSLESILEHIHEAFFVYNSTTHQFSYLSPAFTQVWGNHSVEEAADNPSLLLADIHPEDRVHVQEGIERLQHETSLMMEFRVVSPDGAVRWLCVQAYQVQSGLVAGLAREFSKTKEYEAYIVRINERKDTTLQILAHDLSSPIGLIQGIAAQVERDQRKGVVEVEMISNYMHLVQQTCRQAISLIHDILNQEYLESEETVIKKQRIDLVERVNSVLNTYNLAGKNHSRQFRLQHSTPQVYAEADDIKIMQAINNLISNAVKFTPQNGEITIGLEERETSTFIWVADSGIGIPAHHHQKLFDRFTEARRPGLQGEKSVGLGMSIIKTLVELHGGRIWFESQEGKGSTFYIEIPTQ